MVVKVKNFSKKLDKSKITTNLRSLYYEDKEMQDIMKKYYQIKRNLVIYHNFVNFLED